MFSKIFSAALEAISASIIRVEADISDGLPVFDMVGLLSSEVREAKERVRVALKNSGFNFPPRRITVNLSPADIRKDGTAFDLPIAIAVLAAAGFVMPENAEKFVIIGELSLNGTVNAVNGVLPVVYAAQKSGFEYCMVPYENRKEAAAIDGIKLLAVKNLFEAVEAFHSPEALLYRPECETLSFRKENSDFDLANLVGQFAAKRAIEVAAAGHHNILMSGAPGAGKTMIARCIPGILPELTKEESLELSMVYSVAGLLKEDSALMTKRPFRAPHHTITTNTLVGGGTYPHPGEISLASKGVLFLDELPEFSRNTIEVLRQPLETKEITINRLSGNSVFPADFMLVAAMNPCKCGFYPDTRKCSCSELQINRYRSRISQPLLDRIDIYISIAPVGVNDWFKTGKGESSEKVRKRVSLAREIQAERFKDCRFKTNSGMSTVQVEEFCKLGPSELKLMQSVFAKLELSARGYHRILKVARTIADLAGSENIREEHLIEAVNYRGMEVRRL